MNEGQQDLLIAENAALNGAVLVIFNFYEHVMISKIHIIRILSIFTPG